MRNERSGPAVKTAEPRIRPYQSILVPLDGTPFAEAALRPAADLASRSGASLHLATVVANAGDERRPEWTEPKPPNRVTPSVRRAEALGKELEAIASRVRTEWECPVSFEVLSEAPPSDALAAYAERTGADLIVAATHSRGLIARSLLGSTAVDLVHEAPCPILLVPSEDSGPHPLRTPLQGAVRQVLVALDPEAGRDDPVLSQAVTCASLWDASLLLIQVIVTMPASSPGPGGWAAASFVPGLAVDEKRREMAEARLRETASDLRGRGLECSSEVLRGSDTAHPVFHRVESDDVDLVVVGAHDRGFLERLWSGGRADDKLVRLVRSAGLMVVPLDASTTAM